MGHCFTINILCAQTVKTLKLHDDDDDESVGRVSTDGMLYYLRRERSFTECEQEPRWCEATEKSIFYYTKQYCVMCCMENFARFPRHII